MGISQQLKGDIQEGTFPQIVAGLQSTFRSTFLHSPHSFDTLHEYAFSCHERIRTWSISPHYGSTASHIIFHLPNMVTGQGCWQRRHNGVDQAASGSRPAPSDRRFPIPAARVNSRTASLSL
jgi:hypothetical protein